MYWRLTANKIWNAVKYDQPPNQPTYFSISISEMHKNIYQK